MKKNILFNGIATILVIAFATIALPAHSQTGENFNTIKKRMDIYYDSIIAIRGIDSMQGTGYTQYKRKVSYWEPRLYPYGDFEHYRQQLIDYTTDFVPSGNDSGEGFDWRLIGPDRLPENEWGKNGGVGQIHCIEFDPNNPDIIFACSPVGGLWRSTNYGGFWENAGTDKGMPKAGVSWVAIDENNSQDNWFVATGTAEGMPFHLWWQGAIGVWRTTDGGGNWEDIGVTGPEQMRKIVKIPSEAGKAHLLVVTNLGVYECKNALATEPVWSNILSGNFYDIELHPDPITNLAFVSGTGSSTVWKIDYSDNSNTELQNLGFLPDTAVEIRRISIENSPAAPNYLFVAVSYYHNKHSYLYRYDLSNDTYVYKGELPPSDNSGYGSPGINPERAMGWTVSPVLNGDNNLVMLYSNTAPVRMTYDLLTDGTCSWIDVTSPYGQIETHVDMHCMDFDNYPDLWAGNDGGVYKSNIFDLPNKKWEEKNNGLAVTTVYYVASSELDRNIMLSGQHDNGSNIYRGEWDNNWSEAHVFGGDGMRPLFDYSDPNTMYVSLQGGGIKKSIDKGHEFKNLGATGIFRPTWKTNYIMDTEDPNVLYICGNEYPKEDSLWGQMKWGLRKLMDSVWVRCEKFEEQIPIVGENLYADPSTWAIANTKANPGYIYVSWRGNDTLGHSQHVFKTTVGGDTVPGAWTDYGHPPISVWLTDIVVDDKDPDHIFVSGGGYNGNYVFTVDTSGWQVYNNGVFQSSAKCLALFEGSSDKSLYVGTDLGLFYTNENMDNWINVTSSLPNVGITDLEINYNKNTLVAGTWGRGVWEAPFSCDYSSTPITIASDTTWATDFEVHADVVVENGASLTVTSVIRFAEDARVIVKRGGLLLIDGGRLSHACSDMWQGVEVWGDPKQVSSVPYQGMVLLRNGGTIENAITGIMAARLARDETKGSWIDIDFAGGIVRAVNGNLLNNETGVHFYQYPANGYTYLSSSYFTNSHFIADSNYFFEHDRATMVRLSQINNVRFNHCTFVNNSNIPYSGTGIYSFSSRFSVEGQKNGGEWVNGEFTNLNYGVYAIASGTQYHADIRHTTFAQNHRSVYIGGMDNPRVTSNEFIVSDSASHGAYGLYLDNSTGFMVEENRFLGKYYAPDGKPQDHQNIGIGMIANNSGSPKNEVYNNAFDSLEIATSAQNCNRSEEFYEGLKIRCNDYWKNMNDILVIANELCENPGISLTQGAPGATDKQAGNTFSWNHFGNGPEYSDYDNLECSPITYYHHDTVGTPKVKPRYRSPVPIITTIQQETTYDKDISCKSNITVGGGNTGGDIKNSMAGYENQADSVQALLTALIDGGNSDVLEQQVLQSMPPEAYDLYMGLMGKSPYLSDSVLIAAIEKENVLPNVLLKDILVANPQAAKSEQVMQKVGEKAYPLSDEMLAEVLLGKYIVAAKEKLEAQVDWYRHNRAMALNRLKQYYLSDTVNGSSLDSLILLLESENGLQEKYELVFAYMQKGNWGNAQNTIIAISSSYNLNGQQQQTFSDFIDYIQVMDSLYASDTNYLGLSGQQKTVLTGLADYADNRIGSYARNILMGIGEYAYSEPILLPEEGLKSSSAIQITEPVLKSYPKIKVYPNPASNHIIVEMLTGNLNGAIISLYDIEGKLLRSIAMRGRVQRKLISLTGFDKGIYLLKVSYGGKTIGTDKITIIK